MKQLKCIIVLASLLLITGCLPYATGYRGYSNSGAYYPGYGNNQSYGNNQGYRYNQGYGNYRNQQSYGNYQQQHRYYPRTPTPYGNPWNNGTYNGYPNNNGYQNNYYYNRPQQPYQTPGYQGHVDRDHDDRSSNWGNGNDHHDRGNHYGYGHHDNDNHDGDRYRQYNYSR